MAQYYEYATGPNRQWVNVPGIGEFEIMVDESQKKMVVSDEGYWNTKSPVGDSLKKAVEWANSQGYQGGVVVTPYAFIDKKATEDQLKDYIDSADFVVVDPYTSLRDDPNYQAKADQISNVTKAINKYSNSVGKTPWLVLQNFTYGDQTPEEVLKFNEKILKDNEGLFDTVSFFNKADFGTHESTAGVNQIDLSLTGKMLQDFNIKPDATTIKNYVGEILSYDLSDSDKAKKIQETASIYGLTNDDIKSVTGYDFSSGLNNISNQTLVNNNVWNDPSSTVNKMADQIIAQGLSDKWSGEGAGSAYENARYMADVLWQTGITDINQFGSWTDSSGNTVYGNKITGQVVPNTYGERQTGNAFGGTYAGEGNTAYRVQFDASGKPIFYTTGASSSDVGDLAPLLAIGSMLVAPGLSGLIGGATGLTGGALAAATGATLGAGTSALTGNDILKGALLGGGTGYLFNLLRSGVTDTDLLKQAADADMAAGMLPEYGTNAAYDAAMADLMANSPGAVEQMQNVVNDVTGINADIAGGLIPDYGITYDQVMADLMAQSPGATEQLENIVNSQVGGTLGPDNIDVGGGWSPADTTDYSMEVTADSPVTDYSNEGRNYPGTATTTGSGGSPVNASTSTTTPSLNDVLNVVKAGALVAGITGAASAAGGSPSGFEIVPVPSDWKNPTYGQTGQWPALTPIDFGSRELLRGTQWEKYLNPSQPVTLGNVISSIQAPTFSPVEQVRMYGNELQAAQQTPQAQQAAQAARQVTPSLTSVLNTIQQDKSITPAEVSALQVLSNPNLAGLPQEAASRIAQAVSSPRSYSDVVSGGIATPSSLASMSPEVQKAYEIYQQSMVLGAPRSVAEAAYAAAGVNPTSPDAFFENLGLPTGTPTQDALAKYAPMALNQFAATGGGALTFAVDPSTVPTNYVAPNVPTLATKNTWSPMTTFDVFVNNQISNPNISDAAKQNLITKQAAKYGIDPTPYMGLLGGQTNASTVGK